MQLKILSFTQRRRALLKRKAYDNLGLLMGTLRSSVTGCPTIRRPGTVMACYEALDRACRHIIEEEPPRSLLRILSDGDNLPTEVDALMAREDLLYFGTEGKYKTRIREALRSADLDPLLRVDSYKDANRIDSIQERRRIAHYEGLEGLKEDDLRDENLEPVLSRLIGEYQLLEQTVLGLVKETLGQFEVQYGCELPVPIDSRVKNLDSALEKVSRLRKQYNSCGEANRPFSSYVYSHMIDILGVKCTFPSEKVVLDFLGFFLEKYGANVLEIDNKYRNIRKDGIYRAVHLAVQFDYEGRLYIFELQLFDSYSAVIGQVARPLIYKRRKVIPKTVTDKVVQLLRNRVYSRVIQGHEVESEVETADQRDV